MFSQTSGDLVSEKKTNLYEYDRFYNKIYSDKNWAAKLYSDGVIILYRGYSSSPDTVIKCSDFANAQRLYNHITSKYLPSGNGLATEWNTLDYFIDSVMSNVDSEYRNGYVYYEGVTFRH